MSAFDNPISFSTYGLAEIADLPDHGRDVDHPPPALLDHLVDEDLAAVEHAVQIDGEHLAPGGVVHLHEGLVGVDAGVVDEDVQMAELLEHVLGHAECIRVIGDVGLGENGSASASAMAWPIPRDPPVTRAVRPLSCMRLLLDAAEDGWILRAPV